MNIFQAVILGIVQGLTEFIPVSSTAHLILVERILNWSFDPDLDFAFNVLIQLGTTVGVIIYFWQDLWKIIQAVIAGLLKRQPIADENARLGWLIVVATIPAAVAGLLLKNYVEALHGQPLAIALILIFASVLLVGSEWIGKRNRPMSSANWIDALLIGCAQAVALVPGVSRSGATISGALARNLERTAAARISFLMSIPALIGASALEVKDLVKVPNLASFLPSVTVGFIVAGVVGFISIHWLLTYLARRPMNVFAWYRVIAGIVFIGAIIALGR